MNLRGPPLSCKEAGIFDGFPTKALRFMVPALSHTDARKEFRDAVCGDLPKLLDPMIHEVQSVKTACDAVEKETHPMSRLFRQPWGQRLVTAVLDCSAKRAKDAQLLSWLASVNDKVVALPGLDETKRLVQGMGTPNAYKGMVTSMRAAIAEYRGVMARASEHFDKDRRCEGSRKTIVGMLERLTAAFLQGLREHVSEKLCASESDLLSGTAALLPGFETSMPFGEQGKNLFEPLEKETEFCEAQKQVREVLVALRSGSARLTDDTEGSLDSDWYDSVAPWVEYLLKPAPECMLFNAGVLETLEKFRVRSLKHIAVVTRSHVRIALESDVCMTYASALAKKKAGKDLVGKGKTFAELQSFLHCKPEELAPDVVKLVEKDVITLAIEGGGVHLQMRSAEVEEARLAKQSTLLLDACAVPHLAVAVREAAAFKVMLKEVLTYNTEAKVLTGVHGTVAHLTKFTAAIRKCAEFRSLDQDDGRTAFTAFLEQCESMTLASMRASLSEALATHTEKLITMMNSGLSPLQGKGLAECVEKASSFTAPHCSWQLLPTFLGEFLGVPQGGSV